MIRWVAVIFIALFIFYPLFPELGRLGVGRLPGDIRFKLRSLVFCLPFGSTILWSALVLVIAELVSWSCVFC